MNRHADAHARAMIARAVAPTADDVLAALVGLGDTADAVADRLRALGIKGQRIYTCRCPIAEFIRQRFGLVAFVGARMITVKGWDTSIATPPAVRAFIRAFDEGVHLDLVAVVGND